MRRAYRPVEKHRLRRNAVALRFWVTFQNRSSPPTQGGPAPIHRAARSVDYTSRLGPWQSCLVQLLDPLESYPELAVSG